MQVIYIFLIVVIVTYIIWAKRKFDFLTIYFLGSVVYYLPLALGLLNDINYRENSVQYDIISISFRTYVFGIMNMIIVWVWMVLHDCTLKKTYYYDEKFDKNISRNEYLTTKIMAFFTLFFIILSLFLSWSSLFKSFNKVKYLYSMSLSLGIINTFAQAFGMYILIYAFSRRNSGRYIKLIALLYCAYSLLLGRRSDTVISVISIVTFRIYKYYKYNKYSLIDFIKKNKILCGLLVFGAFLVIPMKRALRFFIIGKFGAGIKVLFESIFNRETYLVSEANSITLYVQKILDYKKINLMTSYPHSMMNLIPFSETLFGNTDDFYNYFQQTFFPGITSDVYGLGGTFWGECYSNGGWILMFIMVNLLCFFLIRIEDKMYFKKYDIYTPIWLSLIGYLSFYIHRLFLEDMINKIKFLLVTAVFVFIVHTAQTGVLHIKRGLK